MISLFLVGVFITSNVSAYDLLTNQKNVIKKNGDRVVLVDSKELTIDDVKTFVELNIEKMKSNTRRDTRLIGISGIFQEGNISDIYFWYGYTESITHKQRAEGASKRIIRLNSGVWFDPEEKTCVTRAK